jgi:hypothetical protein
VRQFLYGQAFFKAHFGRRSTVFWLPDTFGRVQRVVSTSLSISTSLFSPSPNHAEVLQSPEVHRNRGVGDVAQAVARRALAAGCTLKLCTHPLQCVRPRPRPCVQVRGAAASADEGRGHGLLPHAGAAGYLPPGWQFNWNLTCPAALSGPWRGGLIAPFTWRRDVSLPTVQLF